MKRLPTGRAFTVEKKEHPVKKGLLCGGYAVDCSRPSRAYSMSPFTSEESITSSYVKKENPDVIINIVDGTNLSRSLFFTTQLLDLEFRCGGAQQMRPERRAGTKIDVPALSKRLGCPVVETVSTSDKGLKEVIEAAIAHAEDAQKAPYSERRY